MNRHGSRKEFGGWVAYKGSDAGQSGTPARRRALVQDVLVGVCRERGERPRSVEDCAAATSCIVKFIEQEAAFTGKDHRRTIETTIAGITDPSLRGHMERVWKVIEAGATQPWLRGDLYSMYVVAGRVYSYSRGDAAWFSFEASAYRQRVSNYQFASPSEWFAEYYSARYARTTGPAMYEALKKYMKSDLIGEVDNLLALDCNGNPSALRPFTWTGGIQFNEKQRRHIDNCTFGRREDDTFIVKKCESCETEYTKRVERDAKRHEVLRANVLCGTCSQGLARSDIFNEELQELCGQCDTSIAGSEKLRSTWTALRTLCKQAVPACPKRHWTPTPIDSFDGLIPCPWYDL
jgi:hypothetical protein